MGRWLRRPCRRTGRQAPGMRLPAASSPRKRHDLVRRQMRIVACRGVMNDETVLGQVRDLPEMVVWRYAVGRRGFDNRTSVIQQSRSDRGWKSCRSNSLRRALPHRSIPNDTCDRGLRARCDRRPKVDMATIGQTNLAKHRVDRGQEQAATRRRSRATTATSRSASERIGQHVLPDSAASTARVIKMVDFAPSSAAYQNDAPMVANELERRHLRRVHRRLRQDDRAARWLWSK